MNFTAYFLRHPVASLVLNAMIISVGMLCFNSLSVREYPAVNFTTINVNTNYPNASAELVESSVTNMLEERLAGIEGIQTITSESKYGVSQITLNFIKGASIDKALMAIREAVGLVQLPKDAKNPTVQRKTSSSGMPFMSISLVSSMMDLADLTHYANLNLKNAFRSLKDVALVEIWGQPYTYQITLDSQKLYAFGVNADEIFDALKRNNLSLPVGKFQNEISVTLNSELQKISDYENLVIKEKDFSEPSRKQHPVFLKDVADIKLKTDDKNFRVRVNGKPGLCVGIYNASDANPLEVSRLVLMRLGELRQSLPDGLKMNVTSDDAEFVRQSLKNIQSSILEAVLFVLVIVFLFLRNLKATLIPLITVPISLIGSLLLLKAFGFSINIMTLMAMVLAIGLVVDDAIIVMENIQRHIDKGVAPLEAAILGSKEIGFAIIAMTLTLASVYAPLAFISDTIGQLFTEFAVALAGSVIISGVVALTLSPLMCSKFLSKNQSHLWPQVDSFLQMLTEDYKKILNQIIHHRKACLLMITGSLATVLVLTQIIPGEIAPKEDRSLMGVFLPSIPGKDINTMEEKLRAIEEIVKSVPEFENTLLFMGPWGGNVLLPLKPKTMRKRSTIEVLESLRPLVTNFPSVEIYPWSSDSGLPGVDTDSSKGSSLQMVVSTTETYRELLKNANKARDFIEKKKLFKGVNHDLKLDTPGYKIELDRNEMSKLNLTLHQISKTVEVFFSGDQSLEFSKDGIIYPITIKGLKSPWALNELYVTNNAGKRISLAAVATIIPTTQPQSLYHYNQMRSVIISADLSSSEKIENTMPKFFQALDKNLPSTYKKNWTGVAKAYFESKMTMALLFFLALVFIFAILSVQFDNFIDPLIILLTVPLACSGALFFVWIFGQSINIYTQVGLITLIGLITKHGILIVEFANQLRAQKMPLLDAVIEASSLRLRPILMTTGAMLFGAIPLVLSHDAGFEARRAIGTVLIGGIGFGTVFTLFVLPTVYWMVKVLEERFARGEEVYVTTGSQNI